VDRQDEANAGPLAELAFHRHDYSFTCAPRRLPLRSLRRPLGRDRAPSPGGGELENGFATELVGSGSTWSLGAGTLPSMRDSHRMGLVLLAALLGCRDAPASLEVVATDAGAEVRGCKGVAVEPADALRFAVNGPAGETGQILLQREGEPTQFLAGVLFEGREQLVPPEPYEVPSDAGPTVVVLVIDDEELARCTLRPQQGAMRP
jgi:hypothetical protein